MHLLCVGSKANLIGVGDSTGGEIAIGKMGFHEY